MESIRFILILFRFEGISGLEYLTWNTIFRWLQLVALPEKKKLTFVIIFKFWI